MTHWTQIRGQSAARVRARLGNEDVERVDAASEIEGLGIKVEYPSDVSDGYLACSVDGDRARIWAGSRRDFDLAYALGVILSGKGDFERVYDYVFLRRDQASRFAERFLVSPDKFRVLTLYGVPSVERISSTFGIPILVAGRIWEPYYYGRVA